MLMHFLPLSKIFYLISLIRRLLHDVYLNIEDPDGARLLQIGMFILFESPHKVMTSPPYASTLFSEKVQIPLEKE